MSKKNWFKRKTLGDIYHIISKRSQIQFEIGQLIYQINSRYSAYGHIEPSLEKQKEMYDRIAELREQLKNVC